MMPKSVVGDYLARVEIAPEKLYLTNREIGVIQSGYIAEFDARQKIFIGKINSNGENIFFTEGNENFLKENDNFVVKNNSSLILHAGEEVALLSGTEIEFGSNLAAFIQPFNCANLLQRVNPLDNSNSEDIESEKFESINTIENIINRVYVFPNPNNGSFTIDGLIEQENYTIIISDFAGKILKSIQIINSKNQLSINEDLTNGVYFISVNGSKKSSNHKLIIQN